MTEFIDPSSLRRHSLESLLILAPVLSKIFFDYKSAVSATKIGCCFEGTLMQIKRSYVFVFELNYDIVQLFFNPSALGELLDETADDLDD